MNDEFEQWWFENERYLLSQSIKQYIAGSAWKRQQTKIDEQDEKLEALRKFARHAYINTTAVGNVLSVETFSVFGLIDESGNPTPLLTGDK